MEDLSQVVASSAEDFGFEVLLRLPNPLTVCGTNTIFTFNAPGIRASIVRTFLRPTESHAYAFHQALRNVLTHERFLLRPVDGTLNARTCVGFHAMTLSDV